MDDPGKILDYLPMTAAPPTASSQLIPRYALYGEAAEFQFLEPLHIETIRSRSGSNDWIILPHRHGELHQFMLIAEGGGVFQVEGREIDVRAPRLLSIPPAAVHGFRWDGECDGYVLMVSGGLMQAIPEAADVLTAPFEGAAPAGIEAAFAALHGHFLGREAGRSLAMTGYARIVLAAFVRALAEGETQPAPSPEAQLVARLRALIDETYARQPAVAELCDRLGVAPSRLTRACAAVTGFSPLSLLHQRLMLEAKRLLTYTSQSASEISYALGFSEPAYFSRFFSRFEGVSPNRWRRRRSGSETP